MIPEWFRSKENPLLSKTQVAIIKFVQKQPLFTKAELEAGVKANGVGVVDALASLQRLRQRGLVWYEFYRGEYLVTEIAKEARVGKEARK